MIVLDTSALVEFLVGTDPVAKLVRAEAGDAPLAERRALDLECASALRGLVHAGKLPAGEAWRAWTCWLP